MAVFSFVIAIRFYLKKSIGFADFENQVRLSDKSVFEFASMGKIITAISMGILHERGLAEFDDRVEEHIEEFPFPAITIRQLLNHTSGLPDYISYFKRNGERGERLYNQDVLNFLKKPSTQLEFTPGLQFNYSNTGYVILASIIEKVSGYPFEGFIEKYIFNPLDIKSMIPYSFKYHKVCRIEDYAFGYKQGSEGKLIPVNKNWLTEDVYQYGIRPIHGDGNVIGTLKDFITLLKGFNNGILVTNVTKKKFLTPPVLVGDQEQLYGFGVFISADGSQYFHTGSVPGYQSYFKYLSEKDLYVIYVRNVESYNWAWFGQFNQYLEQN